MVLSMNTFRNRNYKNIFKKIFTQPKMYLPLRILIMDFIYTGFLLGISTFSEVSFQCLPTALHGVKDNEELILKMET